jgi:hypothetical protein
MNMYYRSSAGELWVQSKEYIHLVWGPESHDSEAAKDLFNEVVRLLRVTGCRQLLTDQRQRASATEEYMGWLLADWLPRVGTGQLLAQVAVVTARPLDLRLQTVDVCTEGQRRYGILTHFFSTPEAASQWLQDTRLPLPA